jgi:hypothetical protein
VINASEGSLCFQNFVVLPSDSFALFTGTFKASLSLEKNIAYKTFFALKDRLAIIER